MADINRWFRGWAIYFAMTQYPAQIKRIEAHIRRRLRSRLIDQQKSQRNLYRKLIKRGVPRSMAGKVYSNHKRWVLSNSMAITRAYPNKFFLKEISQFIASDKQLIHWYDVNQWIKLP